MDDTYRVCPHILRRLLNPEREVVAMANMDGRPALIVPITEEAVEVKGAGTPQPSSVIAGRRRSSRTMKDTQVEALVAPAGIAVEEGGGWKFATLVLEEKRR
jgi:hypothetical protein